MDNPRMAMRSDNQDLHDKVAAALEGKEEAIEEKKEVEKPKKKIMKLKSGKSYSDSAINLAVKKLNR